MRGFCYDMRWYFHTPGVELVTVTCTMGHCCEEIRWNSRRIPLCSILLLAGKSEPRKRSVPRIPLVCANKVSKRAMGNIFLWHPWHTLLLRERASFAHMCRGSLRENEIRETMATTTTTTTLTAAATTANKHRDRVANMYVLLGVGGN